MAKKKKQTFGGFVKSIGKGLKNTAKKVGKVISKEFKNSSAAAKRARSGGSKSSSGKSKSKISGVQKYSHKSAQVKKAGGIYEYKKQQTAKKNAEKSKPINWNSTFAAKVKTPTGTLADRMSAYGDYYRSKNGLPQSKQQKDDNKLVNDLASWNVLSNSRRKEISDMGEDKINSAINRSKTRQLVSQVESNKDNVTAGSDDNIADSYFDVVKDKVSGKKGLVKGAWEHTKRHYLKPLSEGKLGTVGLNALHELGETTGAASAGLKAAMSEDDYIYGAKALNGGKTFKEQEAWVYSGGKEKQKQLMELGADELLKASGRSNLRKKTQARRAIQEAGLEKEFEKFNREYHKRKNNSDYGSAVKEAYTTHKNFDFDTGNKALDIVLEGAVDPATYAVAGIGSVAAKGASKIASNKGVVKAATKATKEAVQNSAAKKAATAVNKSGITDSEAKAAVKVKAKMDAGAEVTKAEKEVYDNVVSRARNYVVDKAGKDAVADLKAERSISRRIETDEDIEKYLSTASKTKTKRKTINAWENGEKVVLTSDDEIKQFISDSIDGKVNKQAGYGIVNRRLSSAIKRIDDSVDIKDYYLELNPSDLQHGFNGHATTKQGGDLPLTKEDFEKIPEYIDTYDDILEVVHSGKFKKCTLGKRVNGYTVIVEFISDGRKALRPKTVYKMETEKYLNKYGDQIKRNALVDAQAQRLEKSIKTPSSLDIPSTSKIPSAEGKVNILDGEKTAKAIKDYSDDELSSHVESLSKNGTSTEEIYNHLEESGVSVERAMKAMGDDFDTVDPDWEKAAKEAVEKSDPKVIKETAKSDAELFDEAVKKANYKTEAAKVMKNNPDIGQNAAKQNVLYYTTEEAQDMFAAGIEDGMFKKSNKMTQNEAREKVADISESKSVEDMAHTFLGMDYATDPHLFGAYAEKILPELSKKVEAGSREALELLMEVSDHANSIVSHAASTTNAAKMWVKMTPIGRCKAIESEVKRLNRQYGNRLKTPLELSEEQKALIYKASSEDEVLDAVAKITEQMWNDIPSTFWEKVNTARHIGMLLNAKTNVRNVLGNTAFASVRAMSNGLEYVITKSMKSTLEKHGAEAVRATRVTGDELKKSKDFLDKEFKRNYSATSNKYKDQFDMSRPESKTVLESKVGSSVEKFTYWTLEKGDIAFFKPEYKKSYIRYCKSKGIDIDNLDSMSDLQKRAANTYAMREAEKATFRETTAASRALTKLKEKTATGQGKSVAGTAALRVGNVALESALPFVKTPVNVFRQSVDYSPVGLLKSVNEMLTFKQRGNVEALENAIHHMATGLTGSGITVLGAYLYAHGVVTVKAGEKSGDEYYDRDMGYQDYSLVIGNHSLTIDWASPMQSSFFMGAQAYKLSEMKGLTGEEIMDGLLSLATPHLDASFMSSSRDMLEMFVEESNPDRDGKGVASALLKTIGGSIPQNFLQTLLPFSQLMSQTAGLTDEYQRDTRSTKSGTLEKSWDSWGKKMINRIPGLRQKYLNPKFDRRGEDVKSLTADSNIVTKFANAFVNPSNVKEITLDDTDRELIKIYKDIDTSTKDGREDQEYFFYNFTGNPTYDLTNGKRMTYDEAYTYGKASRSEQNNMIQDMLKSSSYKNMTNGMKVDEVKSSYWIGKSNADLETYGADYACESINRVSDKVSYERFKLAGGKATTFINAYLGKEKLVARSHDTSYYTKALGLVSSCKNNKILKAYDIHDDKIELEKEYLKAGGSIREYSNAMCNIVSTVNKSGILEEDSSSISMANKAVAAAHHNIKARTYKAMGLSADQANMGIWFKDNGYSLKALGEIKNTGKLLYDIGTKAGVIDYIESLGLDNNLEKACLFRYMSTANNPYGAIPNYLGLSGASSGGSGRSYGRSGSGRSGSGSSSDLPTWEEWVKKYVNSDATSSGSSSLKTASTTKSAESLLTEAYRKKQRKLVQKAMQ